MPERGKMNAVITILLGCAAAALAIYVLCTCGFYEVTFTYGRKNRESVKTPGLFLCKYHGNEGTFNGPTNGFDMVATVAGFAGVFFGLIATFLMCNSYWKCFCKVRNTAFSSCLFMLATVCQGLTVLVLVSAACGNEYLGECMLLTNAYLSIAAAGTWFLASCFARETAAGHHLPK
jgi:hypothetical protein